MSEESYEDRQARELLEERAAVARFALIARSAAEIGAPLAHRGDGNCGYLIAQFIHALREEGLYKDSVPDQAAHTRGKINGTLRSHVFERDAYRCVKCSSYKDLHADHIIAVANGGPTTFENLQTLCRSCNCSKGAR